MTQEVFSRATSRNVGTTPERFPEHTERDILDRTERGGMARSAGAIRSMADGVQAVRRVAEKRADREIFHELGEDADLEDISIDSTYIKAHKASAGAERGGGR